MEQSTRDKLAQAGREHWADMPEADRTRLRRALSAKAKAWWAAMSPEEREARRVLRIEAFKRKYPERQAAYEAAMVDPQPCHTCGADAWPYFGKLPSNTVLGWRCKEHWPARAKKTPPSGDGGVESAGEILD